MNKKTKIGASAVAAIALGSAYLINKPSARDIDCKFIIAEERFPLVEQVDGSVTCNQKRYSKEEVKNLKLNGPR